MKVYKVVKEFGNARKGDLFNETENGSFVMERIDNEEDISDNAEYAVKSYVSVELSKSAIEFYVKEGFLQDLTPDGKECEKIKVLKEYIDTLIDTYNKDHKEMLEAFENGDVQPCVKVEAETVYFNLIKVLNSIKDKINE